MMQKFFKSISPWRGKQNNKAFTLVEALVAISIFTVSILGLLSVFTRGIADTNYAKRKITAEYLAQEGIEYIRNMRDTHALYTGIPGNSWSDFSSKMASCNPGSECGFKTVFPHVVGQCSLYNNCKLNVDNGNYSTNPGGTDSGFVRKIWSESPSTDEIKIFSAVFWTQGSGSYNITFSENLSNWIQ